MGDWALIVISGMWPAMFALFMKSARPTALKPRNSYSQQIVLVQGSCLLGAGLGLRQGAPCRATSPMVNVVIGLYTTTGTQLASTPAGTLQFVQALRLFERCKHLLAEDWVFR